MGALFVGSSWTCTQPNTLIVPFVEQDLEIASLSSKMETMAFEFADMLKERGVDSQSMYVRYSQEGDTDR